VIDDIDVPDGVTILIESDAGAGTKPVASSSTSRGSSIAQRPTSTSASTPPTRSRRATIFRHPKPSTKRSRSSTTTVGLEHLKYIHLNDSKHACGTNKDEHAHIGEGLIGEDGMERFLNHPDLIDVPLALETPTEDGKSFAWNIDRVRELRAE